VTPLAVVWGLRNLNGPLRSILDFVSGIIFSSFISGQWGATVDAFRHLTARHRARHHPLAILARIALSLLQCSAITSGPHAPRDSPNGASSSARDAQRVVASGHDHRSPARHAPVGRC
jgi:hypothetical protein